MRVDRGEALAWVLRLDLLLKVVRVVAAELLLLLVFKHIVIDILVSSGAIVVR